MEILTNDVREVRPRLTRRAFLGRAGTGLGALALAVLADPKRLFAGTDRWRGIFPAPPFPPRAKRVIHLYQAGGPSHLELFDYKAKLAQMHGEPMPESATKGQPIAQLQGRELRCFAPQHPFERYGRSGLHMTSLLPKIGGIADHIFVS